MRVEIRYADLRPDDLIIDRTDRAWPIAGLELGSESASFWLCESGVRMHHMTRAATDRVTVERPFTPPDGDSVTAEEAVATVEAGLGGEVEAVMTVEEVGAAVAATEESPVRLPPFSDMTPLEMRSHLYLLHGVYAADMRSIAETIAMHEEAHAGSVQSRLIPHTHDREA